MEYVIKFLDTLEVILLLNSYFIKIVFHLY